MLVQGATEIAKMNDTTNVGERGQAVYGIAGFGGSLESENIGYRSPGRRSITNRVLPVMLSTSIARNWNGRPISS
jgi:hypothetical protein